VGIAIQDEVVTRGSTEIDAAALVSMGAAPLDRVVMSGDFDTATGGADDLEADDPPVVTLHSNAAHALLEFLRGEVKERPFSIGPFDSNWRFSGAAGTQLHGLFQRVGSTGDQDDIARSGSLRGFGEAAKRRRGGSVGAGLANWGDVERRGFD